VNLRIAVFALAAVLLAPSGARGQVSVAGLGARYAIPYDDFEDTHDRGYGITWTSVADAGSYWVSLSGGWTRFPGLTVDDVEAPRLDQAETLLGMGLRFGSIKLGAKVGYFFKDEAEWDVVPTATVQFGPLLVSGEAKVFGDVRWYGASATWLSTR
jgi:hypothetical protein